MMCLKVFSGDVNQRKEVAGRLGSSRWGFRFGSSLALAAGFNSASSSVRISISSSSLPWAGERERRKTHAWDKDCVLYSIQWKSH